MTAILYSDRVTSHFSYRELALAWTVVYVSGLIAEIELMWTLFRLRSRWLHILWHALWVAFIAAQIAEAWFLESPAIERLCRIVVVTLVPAFDAILFPVCIRELFRRRGNYSDLKGHDRSIRDPQVRLPRPHKPSDRKTILPCLRSHRCPRQCFLCLRCRRRGTAATSLRLTYFMIECRITVCSHGSGSELSGTSPVS